MLGFYVGLDLREMILLDLWLELPPGDFGRAYGHIPCFCLCMFQSIYRIRYVLSNKTEMLCSITFARSESSHVD